MADRKESFLGEFFQTQSKTSVHPSSTAGFENFDLIKSEPEVSIASVASLASMESDEQPAESPRPKRVKKIPNIVAACFKGYRITAFGREAECLQCGKVVKEGLTSTSNWSRHIRKDNHINLKLKYEKFLQENSVSTTGPDGSFALERADEDANSSTAPYTYKESNPRQKAIRDAILKLVISCSLPMSLTESKHFRDLLEYCGSKYLHYNGNEMMKDIRSLYTKQKSQLESTLREADHVSITVCICTDRDINAYLCVTAHHILDKKLQSSLLSCTHFVMDGNDLEEFVSFSIDATLQQYGITNKVVCVLGDTGNLMRKAFKVTLPMTHFEDLSEIELHRLEQGFFMNTMQIKCQCLPDAVHLQNVAHTIQFVLGNSLSSTMSISPMLKKCRMLAQYLSKYQVPQQSTRTEIEGIQWLSMYNHVSQIMSIELDYINSIAEMSRQTVLNMSEIEFSTLKELLNILTPLYEVTLATQGEKSLSISYALPAITMLRKQLASTQTVHLKGIRDSILGGLEFHFRGMFQLLDPEKMDSAKDPFGSSMYLIATVLDRNWGYGFLEYIVPSEMLPSLRQKVADLLRRELIKFDKIKPEVAAVPSTKCPTNDVAEMCLFADFFKKNHAENKTAAICESISEEINTILSLPTIQCDTVAFWESEEKLVCCKQLALRLLTIPVYTSPIERVLCDEGYLLRPQFINLTKEEKVMVLFLKCNGF